MDDFGGTLTTYGDWFVAPISQTRDSEDYEAQLFEEKLEELGGESDTVAVLRFGHWACGWLDIIVLDPVAFPSNPFSDRSGN